MRRETETEWKSERERERVTRVEITSRRSTKHTKVPTDLCRTHYACDEDDELRSLSQHEFFKKKNYHFRIRHLRKLYIVGWETGKQTRRKGKQISKRIPNSVTEIQNLSEKPQHTLSMRHKLRSRVHNNIHRTQTSTVIV